MRIMTLASRNVLRNWQRTFVTTFAMAFACLLMIIFSTLMDGIKLGSERQAVILNSGDIQIHAIGYRDDPDIYTTIKDSDSLLNKIDSKIFNSTDRRYGAGLVSSESNAAGIQLIGINLIREIQVTEIHKHVFRGQWLDANYPLDVIVGNKLARLLDVKIGSELVFIGQTSTGSMANVIFNVRGILKSISNTIDNSSIFLSNEALIQLLELPEGAHEIVIMRKDRKLNLSITTKIISELAPQYETLNWKKLSPVLARVLDTFDAQTLILLIITYIAVASVVLNAMLMSVFERIHEFGIMKAIGVSPQQSILLIYTETLLQTTFAAFFGLIGGWFVSRYLEVEGIDLTNFSGNVNLAGIALDPVWHAAISLEGILYPVVFLFVIAIFSTVYPAIKIARINAVEAIHYI